MNGNLVVGAVIVLILAAAIGYMIWQRKKGVSSCGCKDCNCCGRTSSCNACDGEAGCTGCPGCGKDKD